MYLLSLYAIRLCYIRALSGLPGILSPFICGHGNAPEHMYSKETALRANASLPHILLANAPLDLVRRLRLMYFWAGQGLRHDRQLFMMF